MSVSSTSSRFAVGPVASGSVSLHTRRLNSGTMVVEHGSSHFYSKYNLLSVGENNEVSGVVAGDSGPGTSSVRIRKLTSAHGDGVTRFPKLEECAHFHYEHVELGNISVSLLEDNLELDTQSEPWLYFRICTGTRSAWTIRRTYDSLHNMDAQLHRCIYSRQFSRLPDLSKDLIEDEGPTRAVGKISAYMTILSKLAGSAINCGPVLSWMEMDNRGNRLIVSENDAAINTPAIGAAHAVKRYVAQTQDELSFEIGDILSIIDKPPTSESVWWRGKKNFEVGYFPSDCVEMICDKNIPASVTTKLSQNQPIPAPVLRKKGMFISKLRTLFMSRPSRSQLKRTGIVKERVFGCDLGEHLLNSGHEVPQVLKSCTEVLEEYGIVDGIYRLSGVTSNIQKLRNEFDEDRIPSLTDECFLQDIHSISSLLKMYFRELPNPLLTYQLYDKFTDLTHEEYGDSRLLRMRSLVQQLPPPHYRTAEYLLRHLSAMTSHSIETSMGSRNLAIVWAPNLLRSKELDQMVCGTAALHGVGLQALVTEYLIVHVDEIFVGNHIPSAESMPNISQRSPLPVRAHPHAGGESRSPTKLLTLAEAQERLLSVAAVRQNYIEVGGGPSALPQYHTIIEHPKDRKGRRSGWFSIFSKSRSASLKDDADGATDQLPGRFTSDRAIKTEVGGGGVNRRVGVNKKMKMADRLSGSVDGVNETPAAGNIEFLRSSNRRSISCDIPYTVSANITPPTLDDDVKSLQGLVLSNRSTNTQRASNDSSDNDVFLSTNRNLRNSSPTKMWQQNETYIPNNSVQISPLPSLSPFHTHAANFSAMDEDISERTAQNSSSSEGAARKYDNSAAQLSPGDNIGDNSGDNYYKRDESEDDVSDLESVYIPPPTGKSAEQPSPCDAGTFATVISPPPIPGLYIESSGPIVPPRGMYVRLSSSGPPQDPPTPLATPILEQHRRAVSCVAEKSPLFRVRRKEMSLGDDEILSSWRLSDSLQSCEFLNEITSTMERKLAKGNEASDEYVETRFDCDAGASRNNCDIQRHSDHDTVENSNCDTLYPKEKKNQRQAAPTRAATSEPIASGLISTRALRPSDISVKPMNGSIRACSAEIPSTKTVTFSLSGNSNSSPAVASGRHSVSSLDNKPPLPRFSESFQVPPSPTSRFPESSKYTSHSVGKDGLGKRKPDGFSPIEDVPSTDPSAARRRSVKELRTKFTSSDLSQPLADLSSSLESCQSVGSVFKHDSSPIEPTFCALDTKENLGRENVPPNKILSSFQVEKPSVDKNSNVNPADFPHVISVQDKRKSFQSRAVSDGEFLSTSGRPVTSVHPGSVTKSPASPLPPRARVTTAPAGELSEQQYSNIVRQGLLRTQTNRDSKQSNTQSVAVVSGTKGKFITRSSLRPTESIVSSGTGPTFNSQSTNSQPNPPQPQPSRRSDLSSGVSRGSPPGVAARGHMSLISSQTSQTPLQKRNAESDSFVALKDRKKLFEVVNN